MKVLPRFDAAERAVLARGVGNGCRVAADDCGRGLLVAYAVPIPNPDLADLLLGLCRSLSWVTWLFRIDFVSGCSSPMSSCATWSGLVRRPGDISRTSLYIAVLVLTIYDEVSVFASVRAAARGYLFLLATRSRSPAP